MANEGQQIGLPVVANTDAARNGWQRINELADAVAKLVPTKHGVFAVQSTNSDGYVSIPHGVGATPLCSVATLQRNAADAGYAWTLLALPHDNTNLNYRIYYNNAKFVNQNGLNGTLYIHWTAWRY